MRRHAMRLLHDRHDHEWRRALRKTAAADARADCRAHERQCVPLRDLQPDHRRAAASGRNGERRWGMKSRSQRSEVEGLAASSKIKVQSSKLKEDETALSTEYSALSTELEEPERYELREPRRYQFGLDRRDVLKTLGGGILVSLVPASHIGAQQRGKGGRGGGATGGPQQIGGWLHIAEDGQI